MKYGAPGSPEELEQRRAFHVKQMRAEREQWREFQEVYRRCRAIAVGEWTAILEAASAQQQTLAEQMRDRGQRSYDTPNGDITFQDGNHIPVPLFTPRDRWQFIKEVTTSLMIDARQRGLTAIPDWKEPTSEAKPPQTQEADEAERLDREAGELAQANESSVQTGPDAPLALVAETDTGQPVQEAPTPGV